MAGKRAKTLLCTFGDGVSGMELGTLEADCCPHMDLGGQEHLSFPVWEALIPLPHTLPSPIPQTEGKLKSGGSTVTCPPRAKGQPSFLEG